VANVALPRVRAELPWLGGAVAASLFAGAVATRGYGLAAVGLGLVVYALVFYPVPERLIVLAPAAFAALPYVDQQVPHVSFITPTRVFVLATIAALAHVERGKTGRPIAVWAAAYFAVILLVTVGNGLTSPAVGQAVDVGLLPYLLLAVLYPRAKNLRLGRALPLVAMAVLAIEVYVGWREFTTGRYLIHFTGTNAPLAYGNDPTSTAIRATGTFPTTETYSLFCALLGLWLCAYWTRRGRGLFGLACAATAATGCLFSGTRDTVLFFVPLVVIVYLRAGQHPMTRAARAAVITVPLLSIANTLWHPLASHTINGRIGDQDNISVRFASFHSAWRIFTDNPLVGVGFGQYTHVASELRYVSVYNGLASVPFPHNTYLAVLAETGLIGVVAFFGLWRTLLRRLWHSEAREISVPLALLLLLVSLADNLGQEAPALLATMFLVGVSGLAVNQRGTPPPSKSAAQPSPGRKPTRHQPASPHRRAAPARAGAKSVDARSRSHF